MVGFSPRGSPKTNACILCWHAKVTVITSHNAFSLSLHLQASNPDELQQLQSQLDSHKEAEQQLSARLAEAEAALKREEEQGQQAERQLGQMVEAQRRLGVELQEGVEAREEAEASRDQAQVLPVTCHRHGTLCLSCRNHSCFVTFLLLWLLLLSKLHCNHRFNQYL